MTWQNWMVATLRVTPGLAPVVATFARAWFPLRGGRCKATWKRKFKLAWREAGPPNHHDDKVDSDQ